MPIAYYYYYLQDQSDIFHYLLVVVSIDKSTVSYLAANVRNVLTGLALRPVLYFFGHDLTMIDCISKARRVSE